MPDELAIRLHEWYLEAIKELSPESYNPNAQKAYSILTEEQKSIDTFIAGKVKSYFLSQALDLIGADVAVNPHLAPCNPQEAQNRLRAEQRRKAGLV